MKEKEKFLRERSEVIERRRKREKREAMSWQEERRNWSKKGYKW